MAVRITKEDELLLEKYSRSASRKSHHLIYGNAILISLTPVWLFWRVYGMSVFTNVVLYSIVSVASAFLMSYAYKNSKSPLNEKTRERTKEVAEFESTTFSIFYINSLFLAVLLFLSMFLRAFSPQFNYLFSMLSAAGATAFLSTNKGSF